MQNNLTIRQIEVDTWIRSKLDVEEYAFLLDSCGSVANFACFIEDLVNRINDGYMSNEVEFRICNKLGLIKKHKIKTIAEINAELHKANTKLSKLEQEIRVCDDKLQCARKLVDTHGYIEALWWVLGSHRSLAESGEENSILHRTIQGSGHCGKIHKTK